MFIGLGTLIGTNSGASSGPTLVDSYSETNQDSEVTFTSTSPQAVAQSFAGAAVSLGSAKFYLRKHGSPTGNAVAKLYNITGTFGSTAKPTGTALATSDNFDISTLTTSFALITFTFSGANQFAMTGGTNYCISMELPVGNSTNFIGAGYDFSSPSHAGNYVENDNGTWNPASTADLCFYVYST